jgi:oligopeptide/dipeptide ABC transporter ATP-binding protein
LETILEVHDLWVEYPTYEGNAKAVNGVSFEVRSGEILGLVGDTGCGKSTAAWAILGLTRPPGRIVRGQVFYDGDDLLKKKEEELRDIRGYEISIIPQKPRASLNPLVAIGNQIMNVYRAHHQASKREARDEAVRLLSLVGINDPERRLSAYPHELSGGMVQRVLIAMALSSSAKLLIADDPTTGVDVTIQAQILDEMQEVVHKTGSTTLMVTRDLGIIANYCERVAVMYAGQIVEETDVGTFFEAPRHPYSMSLHGFTRSSGELWVKSGSVDPRELPGGCKLHPQCKVSENRCSREEPLLREVAPGHFVRCHGVFSGGDGKERVSGE